MPEILIMKAINAENEAHAQKVREFLQRQGILMVNLISSPGSGKTTLLEKTLEQMISEYRFAAIEGDLFTDEDARRLEKYGIPVVQLNTEGACHLTAAMIERALEKIPPQGLDFLVVENIGNLVCPSSFALGEQKRVVLLSVTEGSDKIRKYPKAFQTADLLLITKVDLLNGSDFSLEMVENDFRRVKGGGHFLLISAKSGEGISEWLEVLKTWGRERTKSL